MATQPASISYAPNGQRQLSQCSWATLATGDDGAPVELPAAADRTVQCEGTFGGATVALQGSNDGTNYRPLADPQGVAIGLTAAGVKRVQEITRIIRPVVTGGAGSGLTVAVISRREP